MSLPISFDEVFYFKNQFRGDLIITAGIIYYFPHTNAAKEKLQKRNRVTVPKYFELGTQLLGLAGDLINYVVFIVSRLINLRERLTRRTINRARLGLWSEELSNEELQSRLDYYIQSVKTQSSELVEYQYSLPKPMRFPKNEIKNLRISFGKLKFDTEFDVHDFTVGLRRSKLLRTALRNGGFIE
jgi:hypothetical protein